MDPSKDIEASGICDVNPDGLNFELNSHIIDQLKYVTHNYRPGDHLRYENNRTVGPIWMLVRKAD